MMLLLTSWVIIDLDFLNEVLKNALPERLKANEGVSSHLIFLEVREVMNHRFTRLLSEQLTKVSVK